MRGATQLRCGQSRQQIRRAPPPSAPARHAAPLERVPRAADGPTVQEALPLLLAAPDIYSKRWIWEQYDYQVRTNTLTRPEQTDAAIVRVKETGTSIAMSLDGNGRYCQLS